MLEEGARREVGPANQRAASTCASSPTGARASRSRWARPRTCQLGAPERGQLFSELELLVGSAGRVVGDDTQWWLARKLVVRLPAATLTIAQPKEFDRQALEPDQLQTLRDALGLGRRDSLHRLPRMRHPA